MKSQLPSSTVLRHALSAISCVIAWFVSGEGHGTPIAKEIRQIDFRRFTYQNLACLEQGESVQVTDGKGKLSRPSTQEEVEVEVLTVIYGDLTGEGRDEAVIVTSCSTLGTTGSFTEGMIYTMDDQGPRSVTMLEPGDRADGGISDVGIHDGLLTLERFSADDGPACCPRFIDTTQYRLNARELASIGKTVRRNHPQRIQFERGRNGATLEGETALMDRYVLWAGVGQTLSIQVRATENNVRLNVSSIGGNDLVGSGERMAWSGRLPDTGDYEIEVSSTRALATYTLEITIRDV